MTTGSDIANSNVIFGRDLYNILSEKNENIVFSPFSIHTALSFLYQGADGNTSTLLSKLLNLPEKKSTAEGFKDLITSVNSVEDVILKTANKLYVQNNYQLNNDFVNTGIEHFQSELENVDFAKNVETAKVINDWVEGKTNGKIKNLFKPSDLDSLTRLVIANAIYFKGSWLEKFDVENTVEEPFHINAQDTVNVQMMHLTKSFPYTENEELDAKILQMYYTNKNLSMIIILPNKIDGISDLEGKLKEYDLNNLSNTLRPRKVVVSLPRFTIGFGTSLKETLIKLGLGEIFGVGSNPNFGKMVNSNDQLYVGDVIHKAFIEVNEEGAEAAAATGVTMLLRCARPMKMAVFQADHPFFFILKDVNTGIHFLGRVIRPN